MNYILFYMEYRFLCATYTNVSKPKVSFKPKKKKIQKFLDMIWMCLKFLACDISYKTQYFESDNMKKLDQICC